MTTPVTHGRGHAAARHAHAHVAAHLPARTRADVSAPPPAAAVPTYDASWITPIAAENAAAQARREGAAPAPADPSHHVVFDPAVDPEALRTRAGGTGKLTPRQQADQLLATLVPGSGPIVLGVAGTIGTAWEHVVLTTARSIQAQWHGAISYASIPYPNGIWDNAIRFLGGEQGHDQNVLAMLIEGLHAKAPGRPILIVSESQGSWMVAQTLADPKLAAAVTRVAMFSTPGFQGTPAGVGQAADGAGQLPGAPGVMRVAHDDDVVPHLFAGLTPSIVGGFLWPIVRGRLGGNSHYPPHHYDSHGDDAAAFLLRGVRMARPDHPSSEDPPDDDA